MICKIQKTILTRTYISRIGESDVSRMIVEQHIYLKQEAARKSREIQRTQDLPSDQQLFANLDIAELAFDACSQDPSRDLDFERLSPVSKGKLRYEDK